MLALGLAVSLPALTRAEVAKDWEEVGPAEHSVRQQLLSAPPIVSAVVGDAGVRPPVELPKTADVFNGENQTLANADEAEPVIMFQPMQGSIVPVVLILFEGYG